jgi:hypothetical protein
MVQALVVATVQLSYPMAGAILMETLNASIQDDCSSCYVKYLC